MQSKRVSSRIFGRPTIEVAKRLLGCVLVSQIDGERLAGRIVETEAYHGDTDPACHCYHRRTARNEVMFHSAGTFYVYLIYGMHYCVNVVTEAVDTGAAVLIRALEPVDGIDTMFRRRKREEERELTNGPAKLCQALGIGASDSGAHLSASSRLWIEMRPPIKKELIVATTRIGISQAKDFSWRFYVANSRFVSKR